MTRMTAILSLLLLLATITTAAAAASAAATKQSVTRQLRNNCADTCQQGACGSGEVEICHVGETKCVGQNGWTNGHCNHEPTGQPDVCGSCDGTSGGVERSGAASANCFSGTTTVTVWNNQSQEGVEVMMKDLKIGDSIRTPSGHYEKVYAFGHWQPDRTTEMLEIRTTTTTKKLRVSPEHLLNTKEAGFVPAASIQVGDALQVQRMDSASSMDTATVTSVKRITPPSGLYAPLVQSGTLVVNGGIVASSYVSLAGTPAEVSPQEWIHFYVTPFRVFCLHVAPQMCHPKYSNPDGMPYYIDFGIQLLQKTFHDNDNASDSNNDHFNPYGKAIFLALTVPLILVLQVVEFLLGLPGDGKLWIGFLTMVILQNQRRGQKEKKEPTKSL